jgi:hypothetical protein
MNAHFVPRSRSRHSFGGNLSLSTRGNRFGNRVICENSQAQRQRTSACASALRDRLLFLLRRRLLAKGKTVLRNNKDGPSSEQRTDTLLSSPLPAPSATGGGGAAGRRVAGEDDALRRMPRPRVGARVSCVKARAGGAAFESSESASKVSSFSLDAVSGTTRFPLDTSPSTPGAIPEGSRLGASRELITRRPSACMASIRNTTLPISCKRADE